MVVWRHAIISHYDVQRAENRRTHPRNLELKDLRHQRLHSCTHNQVKQTNETVEQQQQRNKQNEWNAELKCGQSGQKVAGNRISNAKKKKIHEMNKRKFTDTADVLCVFSFVRSFHVRLGYVKNLRNIHTMKREWKTFAIYIFRSKVIGQFRRLLSAGAGIVGKCAELPRTRWMFGKLQSPPFHITSPFAAAFALPRLSVPFDLVECNCNCVLTLNSLLAACNTCRNIF